MLFVELFHISTSREQQANTCFQCEGSEGRYLFEQSHAKRYWFFDIAYGVDEAQCVWMCEIEKMLVQNFVSAIANQEIAQGPCSVLLFLHGIPWLLCDDFEIVLTQTIRFNGLGKGFMNALNLMETRTDATASCRFGHPCSVSEQNDPVLDWLSHHS